MIPKHKRAAVLEDLQNLAENPLTCEQIAEARGVKPGFVRKMAAQHQIAVAPCRLGRPPDTTRDAAIDRVLSEHPGASRFTQAQLAGVSPGRLYARARALGLMKNAPLKLTPLTVFLLELNLSGLSYEESAEIVGSSRQAVGFALKRAERMGYKVYKRAERATLATAK